MGEDKSESGDTSHNANDNFELEEGSTVDMIEIQGSDFQLGDNGCSLRVDDITLRISGNELTASYDNGCSFNYTK